MGIQSLVLTGFWMVENLEDRRWSGVLIVVEIKTKLLPFCKKKHLKTQPNGCHFVRIFSFQISPLLVYLIFQRSRFQMFPDFEWSDLGFPQYSQNIYFIRNCNWYDLTYLHYRRDSTDGRAGALGYVKLTIPSLIPAVSMLQCAIMISDHGYKNNNIVIELRHVLNWKTGA